MHRNNAIACQRKHAYLEQFLSAYEKMPMPAFFEYQILLQRASRGKAKDGVQDIGGRILHAKC